jgi:imidazole glycerol phosphate synthase subunit HisF
MRWPKMQVHKITGMLVVVSLIMATLMPAVVAQSTDQGYQNIANTIEITKISDNGAVKTYIVSQKGGDTRIRSYLVKKTETDVGNARTGSILVTELDANGNTVGEGFGKDSTYSIDSSGNVKIHIGPVDYGYLMTGGELASASFAE